MRSLTTGLLLATVFALTACEDDAGPNDVVDAAMDMVTAEAADRPPPDAGGDADAGTPADAAPDVPTVAVVVVTPANPSIVPGLTMQMRATASHFDGTITDVTDRAVWSSSRPNVATVSAAGLVSALLTGQTNISARYEAVTGSTTFLVTTVATTGITIEPASATLARGASQAFVARLAFSNGTSQDITEAAQWSVDDPAVATVSNQDGQRGRVEAVAAGQTTLRAMSIGHAATASLTVTAP